MQNNYRKRIQGQKNLQLVLIGICLLLIAVYLFYITRPKITRYAIRDECTAVGGNIFHFIKDEDNCANACRAHCSSLDKQFDKSDFAAGGLNCTNTCSCYCQD